MIEDWLELGGFTALGDENGHIALGGHSEIAVDRFGKVQERRGRSRRGESRSDLARGVARFAEATDDQLAGAIQDQPDGSLERFAEAVGQRVQSARLIVEDLA